MTQNEKSKIRAKVIKWVTRLFLILVAIIMLYPLAWNVVSSFKTSTEFLTDPFAWPQGLAWDNYVRAYEKSNLAANIGNSIYVVLETLVIIVICVVPCSYCLVRYKFPGAKLILNIYMAAIFIQATYIMIPLFLQMNKLNLLNSLTALGVQGITVYTQPCHRRSYISLCLSAQPLKTDCSLPWTQSCLPPTFHFHQR